MDTTPNLLLPYIMAAQAQKHVTHNEAVRALDALVQLAVLDRDLAAPPVAASNGARYIVASGPTGAWSGQAGRIAAFQDGAWVFYAPVEGWIAWIADEDVLLAWNGTSWSPLGGAASVNPVALVGVNTTADATNRLAVASAASLFNHAGAGHQLKINKAVATNTASLLYQDNFSGRAEIGLTGDDNFHVKVSADGATWKEAVVVDRATGLVAFPQGGVVTTRSTSLTVLVPEDAATIQAALDLLMAYRFTGTAQGIVSVAAGTSTLTAPIACRHPQSAAIVIRGRSTATLPTKANFTGTKASDETMLRTRWPVVVQCPSLKPLTIDQLCSGLTVEDILFVQTAGATVAVEVKNAAVLNMLRVGLHGFSVGASVNSGGFLIDSSCVYAHAAVHSQLASGGDTRSASPLSMHPGTSHIFGESGARIDATSLIGVGALTGVQVYTSNLKLFAPEFSGATSNAVFASTGTSGLIYNVVIIGTGGVQNIVATNGSVVQQVPAHTGSPIFSPAIGVVGNGNSIIV